MPEGNTSATEGLGATAAPKKGDRGPFQSVPHPNTTPETHKAPKSDERPPAGEERTVTCANPEAPDTMMGMLQHASVSEEHRTLMSIVAERILSAKSGLNEAFMSLLRGFKMCTIIFSICALYAKCTCV